MFAEVYKVRNKINIVIYDDGELIYSAVGNPTAEDKDINDTIERLKKEFKRLKINYQIYR